MFWATALARQRDRKKFKTYVKAEALEHSVFNVTVIKYLAGNIARRRHMTLGDLLKSSPALPSKANS